MKRHAVCVTLCWNVVRQCYKTTETDIMIYNWKLFKYITCARQWPFVVPPVVRGRRLLKNLPIDIREPTNYFHWSSTDEMSLRMCRTCVSSLNNDVWHSIVPQQQWQEKTWWATTNDCNGKWHIMNKTYYYILAWSVMANLMMYKWETHHTHTATLTAFMVPHTGPS